MSEEQFYHDVTKHSPGKSPRQMGMVWGHQAKPELEYDKAMDKAVAAARAEALTKHQYQLDEGEPMTMDRVYCEIIAEADLRIQEQDQSYTKLHADKNEMVSRLFRLKHALTELQNSPALKDQPVLQAALIGVMAMAQ